MNVKESFSRVHGFVFFGLAFALLAIGLAFSGSLHESLVLLAGPFAGAVARDWQSCCAEVSWSFFPPAVAVVAVGALFQVFVRPGKRTNGWRYVVWGVGLLGWYLAGIPTLVHAVS